MTSAIKAVRPIWLLCVAMLVSCGGGGGGNSSAPALPATAASTAASYAIGGSVTGLSAKTSVVLSDNGSDRLTVSANGPFSFADKLPSGASYAVTVTSSPSGETCLLTGASGTVAMSTVSTVATNAPGARIEPATWTDAAHNLWMFGGVTDPSALGGTDQYFGDLWSYSTASHQWTWMGGSSAIDTPGSYGLMGAASATNVPGARSAAQTWADANGNFWLYGGTGYDSVGAFGILGDLWKFSVSSRQWTWVAGSSMALAHPVYGTMGTAAASNTPGGRMSAVTWVDASGTFWMFGGGGFDSTGGHGNSNELWQYLPSTNQWTWVGGSDVAGAPSNYGTRGQAAPSNVPGARIRASSWVDTAGNLWLFGGQFVAPVTSGPPTGLVYDDLWKYDTAHGLWTWVAGSQIANGGSYGMQGVASAANDPGPRFASYAASDSTGNFWLFGGFGSGPATTAPPPASGYQNDLWMYSPSAGEWTWIAGSSTPNAGPNYGVLGVGASTTVPGGRSYGAAWSDGLDHLWIFGGTAIEASATQPADDNTLWEYQP